jgi:hypothetical protein
VTETQKPPAATGGKCQSSTIRKKPDMNDDTSTPRDTTRTCPFTWCRGHDDWDTATDGTEDPQRIHLAAPEVTIEPDRAAGPTPPATGSAVIAITEKRTPTGAVYSRPSIRLDATGADLGPDTARALAEGLNALAATLEDVDAEVEALS